MSLAPVQVEPRLRHSSVESLSAWRVIGDLAYAKNERGGHTLIARDGWRRVVWELVIPLCVAGIVGAGSIAGGMASGIAAISVVGGMVALGMVMLIGHLYAIPNPMNGAALVTFDASCARITLGLGQLVVIRKPVACLLEWIYFGPQFEAPGVHVARLVMDPEESPDDSIAMAWKHGLSKADIRAIESLCRAAGIPVERARSSRKLTQHSPASWARELEGRQGFGRTLAKPYWAARDAPTSEDARRWHEKMTPLPAKRHPPPARMRGKGGRQDTDPSKLGSVAREQGVRKKRHGQTSWPWHKDEE